MQSQQGKYQRKNNIRRAIRIAVFVGTLAVGYFLHGWLDTAKATVTDQAITYLTLVLVLVTYLQWDVMAEQNIAIERQLDQAEFQQRAWLAAFAAEIAPFVPPNSGSIDVNWSIVIRNTGSTPGTITHSRVEYKLRTVEEAKPTLQDVEIWISKRDTRSTVVAPGGEMAFRGTGRYVSGTDTEEVRRGATEAYLLGCFFYTDVFGGEHKTTCIFKYDRETGQLNNNHQDGEMT